MHIRKVRINTRPDDEFERHRHFHALRRNRLRRFADTLCRLGTACPATHRSAHRHRLARNRHLKRNLNSCRLSLTPHKQLCCCATCDLWRADRLDHFFDHVHFGAAFHGVDIHRHRVKLLLRRIDNHRRARPRKHHRTALLGAHPAVLIFGDALHPGHRTLRRAGACGVKLGCDSRIGDGARWDAGNDGSEWDDQGGSEFDAHSWSTSLSCKRFPAS